jgi:beta-glucosidase
VTFVQGTKITRREGPSNSTPTDQEQEVDIDGAVRAAQNVDVIVLALGEGSYCETPGNITDLTIGAPQIKLAEALKATGKPIVLVLVEGRPRIINRIADSANAIVMAYNPSHEGGTAIADVLFGDVNPSGRLPFTYPRTPNGLINYDHKPFETENTSFGNMAFNPQFRFGDGLSYTTFTYSDLRLGKDSITANEELPVSVTVKNTGNRVGKEAVLLYVSDLVASISPPGRRLRRFAKVSLEPGQSRTLTFKLRSEDLSFINADNKRVAEPGEFDVKIGALSQRFTLK